jgi:hypothetical protein
MLNESNFLLHYTYITCLFSCWYFSLHSNDTAFPNTNNELYPYDQFTVIVNILGNWSTNRATVWDIAKDELIYTRRVILCSPFSINLNQKKKITPKYSWRFTQYCAVLTMFRIIIKINNYSLLFQLMHFTTLYCSNSWTSLHFIAPTHALHYTLLFQLMHFTKLYCPKSCTSLNFIVPTHALH